MITSNESRIIRDFLDLIYDQGVKDFFVYINHERMEKGKLSKSTFRSIMAKNSKEQGKSDRDGSFISSHQHKHY